MITYVVNPDGTLKDETYRPDNQNPVVKEDTVIMSNGALNTGLL